MHLYEGSLYWDKTVAEPLRFAQVKGAEKTGILIVGGGLTGNLCANVLSAQGLDVMVVERNRIGTGSTLANTGLLQYRSDKMMIDFADEIGEEAAYLFYRMCLEAMDKLTALNDILPDTTDYCLKDSIYFASTDQDKPRLLREYEYLTKYNFPVEFLDGDELIRRYGITKACALRTWHDAQVNPYKFVQALTRKNLAQGVRYFEQTAVDLDRIHDGRIFTRAGDPIDYDYLVQATGYSRHYAAIESKIIVRRTYAFCSAPLEQPLWPDQVMIWETRNPYLYLRAAAGNRIIAGGLDEDTYQLEMQEEAILAKAKDIARQINSLFPLLEIDIEYAWNAIFCGSSDGMPFIGPNPARPNEFFVLGYEGNGVCYSMAGALILSDYIGGKVNPYQAIVKVDRK